MAIIKATFIAIKNKPSLVVLGTALLVAWVILRTSNTPPQLVWGRKMYDFIPWVGGKQTTTNNKKWHHGPHWERLFRVYDILAQQQYGQHDDCESRLIPSSITIVTATAASSSTDNDDTITDNDESRTTPRYWTQVHVCGVLSNPPVVFFHGGAFNSLMYGGWLISALKQQQFFTVAVDFPCDLGRSFPAHYNVANCPATPEDIAAWALDLMEQMDLLAGGPSDGQQQNDEARRRPSLVGYSYGSFVASQVALQHPAAIDKLVLFAPAAVFAPFQKGFLVRVFAYMSLYHVLPSPRIKEWLRRWFTGWLRGTGEPMVWGDENYKELSVACDEAGPAYLPVAPTVLDADTTLTAMNRANPTLLILGQQEVVTNVDTAVAAAKKAGIQVKLYPNCGHFMSIEQAGKEVIPVVVSFLNGDGNADVGESQCTGTENG